MKVQKIGVVGLALAAAGAVALAPTAGAVPNEFVGKTDQQLAQAAIERAGVVVGSRVNAVVNAPQNLAAWWNHEGGPILAQPGVFPAVIDYVDGPQWASEPVTELVARHVPVVLGGGTNGDTQSADKGNGINGHGPVADGAIMQFRNDVVINAVRPNVRERVVTGIALTDQTRNLVKNEVNEAGKDLNTLAHTDKPVRTLHEIATNRATRLHQTGAKIASEKPVRTIVKDEVARVNRTVTAVKNSLHPKPSTGTSGVSSRDASGSNESGSSNDDKDAGSSNES